MLQQIWLPVAWLNIALSTTFVFPSLPGDVNQDGVVNLLDVSPFVDVVSSGGFQVEADINQDGVVNLLDVGPFIELLNGEADPAGDIVPLFDANTPLEPDTVWKTQDALITRVGDRVRDRHAREDKFQAYDHYLAFYWQERTVEIEIVDRVAMGGSDITINTTSLIPLGTRDFRAFFRGLNTPAEYFHNVGMMEVATNHYTTTITFNAKEGRSVQAGDRMEFEFSPFLAAPMNGRTNYYGTAFLYVVGEGLVPWEAVGPIQDSFALPASTWLGGKTTIHYQYSDEPDNLFKQMAGNMAPVSNQPFVLGRRVHHTDFGSGAHSEQPNPVFTEQIGKLGPKYIGRSCVACHVNNGRALPPQIGQPMLQSVVRLASDECGTPDPVLGSVLQPRTVGAAPEGSASIDGYTMIDGQFGDGTSYTLRRPNYSFTNATPSHFSVRLAPPLVGLGLLEAIDEADIVAMADPDDLDGDGISGRVQVLTDPETGQSRLGRFTSKGGQARLSHQIAAALNTDMGVTTSVFPQLDGDQNSGPVELDEVELFQLTRYVATLGVGASRDYDDPEVLLGQQLFDASRCNACHTPTLTTGEFHPAAELRGQTIHPYTDLLLHDLGPDLADTLGEGRATGTEWRTPPLWSIGHTAAVSGGEAYLHDGRARTLSEAILWHGGEAEPARESFRTMSAANRAALIKFLNSL